MTTKQYERKRSAIKNWGKTQIQMQELLDLKQSYKRKKNKLPTSKVVLIIVFALALEIIFFCEYMMIKYADFTALYALIGIPATLVPTILGYFNKAKAENSAGGITYDIAMMEHNSEVDQPQG